MQTGPHRARGAIPGPGSIAGLLAAGVAVLALAGAAVARVELPYGDWPPRWTAKIVHASWYGQEFARRRTASCDRFNPHGMTGAHRTLPLGTRLRVTNLSNGRSVLVTINDRGPFIARRELDLSYGAARAIGMVNRGVERVLIEPIVS